jgi:hypothetical protein
MDLSPSYAPRGQTVPDVSSALSNPAALTVMRLGERNALAHQTIQQYADRHAMVDVSIGLIGFVVPGAAIPCLLTAIAAQAPLIYQPLARDLSQIYAASPDDLRSAGATIIGDAVARTAALEIASEFGTEFLMQIANELLVEGLGVAGSLAVPFIGGAVGAALDYLIATQMTWRVGTMVSIYFQNGGAWVGNRQETFERAKEMTGKLHVGVSDLLDGKYKNQVPRVDLNDVPRNVGPVREKQIRVVRAMVGLMRGMMNNDQIRAAMNAKGIPADLIDEALRALA